MEESLNELYLFLLWGYIILWPIILGFLLIYIPAYEFIAGTKRYRESLKFILNPFLLIIVPTATLGTTFAVTCLWFAKEWLP